MNVNKIIKYLEIGLFFDETKCQMAIDLLHQQQAEIETLKAKTLTDDEMEIITKALLMIGLQDYFINYDFKEKALAILKKASEK